MSKITASRPGTWINDLFPKGMTDEQHKQWRNIWWRVVVMWIPPRDSRFEYELNMGMGKIDAVFNKQPLDLDVKVDGGGEIMFVFPERWLSTQEEQLFVPKLYANPQIKEAKLTIIDIVTKSPLIVANFIKEDVRIVKAKE